MPQTKFQSIVFTLIMVFCMVFSMTVYTLALNTGELTYRIFAMAIKEMWLEYIIVFVFIFFAITKIAKKLMLRILTPGVDKPIFITLAVQSFTVVCIVPAITLVATFIHNGFTGNWFVQWIATAVTCFPMAYCLQIFFVGPFVRLIFRIIFKKQLSDNRKQNM
ncbi:MAG: DUF2798 domain-containing protein [Candidatus Ornithomonoglobus sp.]